jgi:E3 ubiquitin-protein ligase FANCL
MAPQTLLPDGDGGYLGYLTASGERFAFRVHVGGSFTCFDGCPQLRAALTGHEDELMRRLQRSADANSFLAELTELLEREREQDSADKGASATSQLPSTAFYELLVSELDAVGWGLLVSVSPALDELQLQIEDAAGRAHVLELAIPSDYPRSPPRARASLPVPFELRWTSDASTTAEAAAAAAAAGQSPLSHSLCNAIAQFRAALARHQQLWDVLDDLDAHTWVLEPKNPTRDCATRRIAIGDHCSLQLEVHIGAPTSLPELQFLGADRVIAPLRQALNANLSRWSPERSVRLNLAAVLERDFPTRQLAAETGSADDYSVECAICYSYHLDGAVPECACDGCSKPFHKACLTEWLRALPTTQQSFNRLFGECPYCGHPIACEAVST